MYWPIGVPCIFAVSKHDLDHKQTTSDDGVTTPTLPKKSLDKEIAANEEEDSAPDSTQANGNETKKPGRRASENGTSKSNGTSKDEAEKDPGGEIVGIAVARSGHMFITITRSTLTVWQTKVAVTFVFMNTLLIQQV